MAKPRRRVSPEVDEFLSQIVEGYVSAADAAEAAAFARALLGEEDPLDTAALARELRGEGDPAEAATFARIIRGESDPAETATFIYEYLRKNDPPGAARFVLEWNSNPDQPRDAWGRWTDGSDNATKAIGRAGVKGKYSVVGGKGKGPIPKGTLIKDPHTITVLVGHGYSVRDMLKNYTKPGEAKPPAAGSAIIAAIACIANQEGIRGTIQGLGLLPPSWNWPAKPVVVKDGVDQLVKGLGDLLQEGSNLWGNKPDFKGITLQIVADPTAANGLSDYKGDGKLPPQLGNLTPKTLVTPNPVGPPPRNVANRLPDAAPWHIITITIPKEQMPKPNPNGSLNAPNS